MKARKNSPPKETHTAIMVVWLFPPPPPPGGGVTAELDGGENGVRAPLGVGGKYGDTVGGYDDGTPGFVGG